MKRIAIAVAIAGVIYALAVGVGAVLYATGVIATGATNNNCANFKQQIADERGIDEQNVPQSEVSQRTRTCLDGHELTKRDAFRTEYLFWSLWPGAISGVIFLVWPRWSRILRAQQDAEDLVEGSKLDAGMQEHRDEMEGASEG